MATLYLFRVHKGFRGRLIKKEPLWLNAIKYAQQKNESDERGNETLKNALKVCLQNSLKIVNKKAV